MRNIVAIAKREMESYLAWPITYGVAAMMLALFGVRFSALLRTNQEASLRPLFTGVSVIFVFVAPVLTMRLLAEERRRGTIELLLTSPVRSGEVALGKFLASLGISALMLTPTLYYVFVLALFGRPDAGSIIALYLGLLLLAGALLAIGTLASALASNQFLAAGLGIGLGLLLWLLPAATAFAGEPLGKALRYLGVSSHLGDFLKGVVDTKDIVFYVSVMAGSLFLASRALESRRGS